ncbi:DEAD/DEAH box helicase [Loigolactobacillus backii]|uniref:DEAD/DEAH box helicase n=1 Tax=Loigolactobacillus backii TaxID=375175 RepID=UPI0007F0A675|nr:DEAD/DEAH box helicase [Loigolactobacillus backii]ANK60104.1 helicase [Loigolactobacillus backii]
MPSERFTEPWQALGLGELTAIQKAVYEPLKKDVSILGLAPTGSGKTLAFALPLLEKLLPGQGIQLLILAPSQELVMQEKAAIQPFAKAVGLTIQAVAGGANIKRQIERLKKKPEVLVAAEGRLLELIDQRKVKLHTLQTIVIDEADQQLVPDKLEKTRDIVRRAPGETQLAFFSATKTPILDELPKWFGLPIQTIDVREIDDSAGKVLHYLLETPIRKRTDMLRRLSRLDDFYGLVFFATLAEMANAAEVLGHQHVSFAVLNGQMRQVERERALADFRQRKVKLLLTTDVAARGLDIAALPAVVNFDLPRELDIYIHRVGRTGRMGHDGLVINLGNKRDFRDLKQVVRDKYQLMPVYLTRQTLTTDSTEVPVVEKPKQRPTSKHKRTPKLEPKTMEKPKKKHRKRDQRNKGKHKSNKKVDQ